MHKISECFSFKLCSKFNLSERCICCRLGGNGGGSGDGDGYPSPQHSNVASQPQLTPGGGGGGDGMSSDCSDDESSPQSNRQMPVVYPWMKKIHVGGVGKNAMTYFDGSPSGL